MHGFVHRPTFEANMARMQQSNANENNFEFHPLFNAVLGLGAYFLGEAQQSEHFLRVAWQSLLSKLLNFQTLKIVQGIYLLVVQITERC